METWVQHIGTAPIATAFAVLFGVVGWLARYVVTLHNENRQLLEKVTEALSANASAMASMAASSAAAREAMQIAAAVMADRQQR